MSKIHTILLQFEKWQCFKLIYAKLDNGVLKVLLPKAKSSLERKISAK